MPDKKTIERAKRDKREGKAPSTQAGEFVREEIEHVREGKHGVRNTKQAIAIGLSKARRAGVKLPAPKKGTASPGTRKKAKQDLAAARPPAKKRTAKKTAATRAPKAKAKRKTSARRPSATRSRATTRALQREGRAPVSPRALSRRARSAATRRRKRGASTRESASTRGTASKSASS
jgi:hypothetical protein